MSGLKDLLNDQVQEVLDLLNNELHGQVEYSLFSKIFDAVATISLPVDWVSVDESLPKEWQQVLVCNINAESDRYGVEPDVLFATYTPCSKGCCDPKFETQGNFWMDHEDVTHWIPLPLKVKENK